VSTLGAATCQRKAGPIPNSDQLGDAGAYRALERLRDTSRSGGDVGEQPSPAVQTDVRPSAVTVIFGHDA
jgi:hypothetical protein